MSSNAATARGAGTVPRNPDVVIIGDGLIGLSTALELGRAGATCCVIGARQAGAASAAAAGLLAPSIKSLPDAARQFYDASLDRYPTLVASLQQFDPGLSLVPGLVEVLPPEASSVGADLMTPDEVAKLEPALAAPFGARLHAKDCAIDNVRLLRAVRAAVERDARVVLLENDPVVEVDARRTPLATRTASGRRVEGATLVLAAGAWVPAIRGVPHRIPVTPLKGQMLAFAATPLCRSAMSDEIYLVPRETETLAGATVENAGFDTATSSEAINGLKRAAIELCPALGDATVIRTWAGIRPATPDLMPIIGPDPDVPSLLYACGHSKNGILLAPETAFALAALAAGRRPETDLGPFSIDRFDESASARLANR
jgi:glycine oxidase